MYPITDGVTPWALNHVTNMRNPSDAGNTDNKCIALAKKGGRIILAEVAYAILPLVAIVEVVVAGIIAFLATGVSYCFKNQTVQDVVIWARESVRISGIAGVMSVAALVWNFTTEKLDMAEMCDAVCPCMRDPEINGQLSLENPD